MKFHNTVLITSVCFLTACSRSDRNATVSNDLAISQKLCGRWLADSRMKDRQVRSLTVVDAQGRYTVYLTNVLSGGVRIAKLAGTLQIQGGLLVDTITNAFGANTRVPRIDSVMKIIRLDDRELVLSDTNNLKTVTYRKDQL